MEGETIRTTTYDLGLIFLWIIPMGPPAATNGGLKSWTPESGSSRTDKHCWQMHGNCRELAINSQKILLEVQEPNQATNYSQVFHCWHLLSSFRTEDAVNSLNLMGKIKHMDMRSFSALVVIGISHLPLCHLPRVLGGPRGAGHHVHVCLSSHDAQCFLGLCR